MEDYQKKALNSNTSTLLEEFDPYDVIDKLISNGIMSNKDKSRLTSADSRQSIVSLFLSTLQRRGKAAFRVFVEALNDSEEYKELATALTTEAEKFQSEEEETRKALADYSGKTVHVAYYNMKWLLAKGIGKLEASKLKKHFSLPDVKKGHGAQTAVCIVKSLEEKGLITPENVDNLRKAAEILRLTRLQNVLADYARNIKLPEISLQLFRTEAIPNENQQCITGSPLEIHGNNLPTFLERLGRFLRKCYNVEIWSVVDEKYVIILKASSAEGLCKLRKDIDSGSLGKTLISFMQGNCNNSLDSDEMQTNLIESRHDFVSRAEEKLRKLGLDENFQQLLVTLSSDIPKDVWEMVCSYFDIPGGKSERQLMAPSQDDTYVTPLKNAAIIQPHNVIRLGEALRNLEYLEYDATIQEYQKRADALLDGSIEVHGTKRKTEPIPELNSRETKHPRISSETSHPPDVVRDENNEVRRKGTEDITQMEAKRQKTFSETNDELGLSPYRVMMHGIEKSVTKDDVNTMARLASLTTQQKDELKRENGNGFQSFISILEKERKISEANITFLRNLLLEVRSPVEVAFLTHSLCEGFLEEDSSNNQSVQQILHTLGLENYFPGKLKLRSFMKVTDNRCENDFCHYFWHKLSLLDVQSALFKIPVAKKVSIRDILFCVLHCADDFLRQSIFERLHMCKLAVPILLQGMSGRNPQFLLFSLQKILSKRSGKYMSLGCESPIINYPLFTVLAVRIGNIAISKSDFLNSFLSHLHGSDNNYFISRTTDFVESKCGSGSIDCTWLHNLHFENESCPDHTVAFLNLRGDCREYPNETAFASEGANVVVAITAGVDINEYEEVRKLQEINRNVVLVETGEENSSASLRKGGKILLPSECLVLHSFDENIHPKLRDEVSRICIQKCRYKTLQSFDILCEKHKIEIDNQNVQCSIAKEDVENIFPSSSPVNDLAELEELKHSTFQLRQFTHPGASDSAKDVCLSQQRINTKEEEKKMKEEQIHKQFSSSMRTYKESIIQRKAKPDSMRYFFNFLHGKVLQMVHTGTLKTRDRIVQLEEQINKLSTARAHKEETVPNTKTLQQIKHELTKYYSSVDAQYMGCEHFLLQLQRLYEAFSDLEVCPRDVDATDIKQFPEIAARIVHEIHAFQIVEKENENLSLPWVTAVLDSLTTILEDPKVYVISVLGMQSASTSTFIDDLFGVQYPVRVNVKHGMFLRFLQLNEKLAEKLQVNYLIVIETEKVRQNEDRLMFDNKLVSLAVSMANLTLFVIEEESELVDVKGALDVALHAIMRSDALITKKRCKIVKTCGLREDASNSFEEETMEIKLALNEAVKTSVEAEGLGDSFQNLSDLMEVEKCESLPSTSSTTMLSQADNYADRIERFKADILESITKQTNTFSLKLSNLTEQLKNVWQEIDREHFFFKFPASSTGLTLNRFFIQYISLKAEIRQQIDDFTYRYLSKEMYGVELTLNTEKWESSLKEEVERQKQKLLKFMEYYTTEQSKGVLTKAQQNLILDDISTTVTEIEKEASSLLFTEYEMHKARENYQLEFKLFWKVKLSEKAHQRAQSLREGRRDDGELEALYDVEWDNWMKMIHDDINQCDVTAKNLSLEAVCEKLLLKITGSMAVGNEIKSLILQEGGLNNHCEIPDWSEYICTNHLKNRLGREQLAGILRNSSTDTALALQNEKDKFEKFVSQTIKRNVEGISRFQYKVIRGNTFQLLVEKAIKNLLSNHQHSSNLCLLAKGLLHFSGKAVQNLKQFKSSCEQKISEILKSERQMVLEDFLVFCKDENSDLRAAEFLYYSIEMLYRIKTRDIFRNVRRNFDYKRGTECLQEPLRDLLHFAISSDPTLLFNNKMYPVINAYVNNELSKLKIQLHKDSYGKVQLFVPKLMETIADCEKELSSTATFHNWCDRMGDILGSKYINIAGTLFNVFDRSKVRDSLKMHINTKLTKRLGRDCFGALPMIDCAQLRTAIGLGRLCYYTCPLCGVHCDKLADGHSIHSSSFHRPRGLGDAFYPNSLDLVAEDCVSSIQSKTATFSYMLESLPCYKYKEKFPFWEIHATRDSQDAKIFWRWIFVQKLKKDHSRQLQSLAFPLDWLDITKEEALQSLNDAIVGTTSMEEGQRPSCSKNVG